MSKLIINENPLLVLPSLASSIGLNEAIMLQQIHYWLDPRINKNIYEEKHWVYNTYDQWQKQFPFWSVRSIRRIIQSLEEKNLLITKSLNSNNFIKTKWYSINYISLNDLNPTETRCGQLGLSICPIRPMDMDNLATSYKDTEITTETTIKNSLSPLSMKVSKIPKQLSLASLATAKENERENKMLKIWNEVVEEKNQVTINLTPKRAELLDLRLKEFFYDDISLWEAFCKKVASSKFLMGEITNFKIQLDWALKEENLLKIVENSYGMGDRLNNSGDNLLDGIDEMIINPLWKQTREKLKEQLGEGTFKSWITKLDFKEIVDETAYFIAPTKFIQDWIITNYSEAIKRNLNINGANIHHIFIQCNDSDIKG